MARDAKGVTTEAAGTRQDISGAVTSVIMRYVRSRAGEDGVTRTLGIAGEPRSVESLEDPLSWSSEQEAIALMHAAAIVTGDEAVAKSVGEEMLRQHDGTDVANLLRSLGSPAELLRNVTAAAAKFATVSSFEPLEVGDAHAVVKALARSGYQRHPDMCEFSKGLLSQVPVLFGMVPATVSESECQAKGGRYCLYSVAWEAGQWSSFVDDRTSLFSVAWKEESVVEAQSEIEIDDNTRTGMLEEQIRQMGFRLEEVYSTAAELLSVEDLTELLANITRRAAGAVNAPRYLLVVQTADDEPRKLQHHGLDTAEAEALAEELWQPDPDDAGGSRLIVDIASARRHYGKLAAIYPPGMRFMARERELFSLYANYAATALDLVTSLTDARRSNTTANALLDFSRALARVGTTDEVAQTLADTFAAVARSASSSVYLWEPSRECLVQRAASGDVVIDPEEAPTLVPDNTPLVERLMGSREMVVVDRDGGDPHLTDLLTATAMGTWLVEPLYSDEEFLGAVVAEYAATDETDHRSDNELRVRLAAVADQSVTSFQNARLLEQIGHLAWHDALTGLPNRRLLEDRVIQELERDKRLGETLTMFFIDLDRFKHVNDTLGHAAGDDLIRQVAGRVLDVVRRQDTVARLGGDEFAVLFPGLSDLTAIKQLADRAIESLNRAYLIEGKEVYTSASIGISIYPEHGETYDDLLNHADEAMYVSKSLGRNTYNIFRPESARATTDIELQGDLRRAIERHELFVMYQPYIDLQTNKVVGVEALVRWRHPDRGVLEPGAFIPHAEESDLIVDIDRFVIEESTRQMRAWLDEGLPPLRMSVNAAGRDLLQPDFVDKVMAELEANGIAPEWFEVEITERVTIDDSGKILETTNRLRDKGVRFSIDDFGVGTSSIQQVAALPVSTLKIDQSFVQILGPTEELNALAAGIISMADKLGLDCVAEGVETSHQSRVLLQRGCNTAQGFYFSPPLPPHDVRRMLDPSTEETAAAGVPGAIAQPTPAGG